MFMKGEQVHAGLWAGHGFVKPTMDCASREYAFEGQVFVIIASGYINEDMIPDSFPLKKFTTWDFPGGSGIINPRAEYIAGPLYDREGILYAEIDMDMIIRAKAVIDSVGHFSRPDILSLRMSGEGRVERIVDNSDYLISKENYEMIMNSIEELREKQGHLDSKIDSIIKALETRKRN